MIETTRTVIAPTTVPTIATQIADNCENLAIRGHPPHVKATNPTNITTSILIGHLLCFVNEQFCASLCSGLDVPTFSYFVTENFFVTLLT